MSLEFDHVVIVCKGCGGTKTHFPDRPFQGAEELIAFLKGGLADYACECGSAKCDIKAHMKGNPCLSCGQPKATLPHIDCETPDFHHFEIKT